MEIFTPIIAFAALLLSLFNTWENRKFKKLQKASLTAEMDDRKKANIIACLSEENSYPQLLVKNIGRNLASNIRFENIGSDEVVSVHQIKAVFPFATLHVNQAIKIDINRHSNSPETFSFKILWDDEYSINREQPFTLRLY
jgi:hypothetical protein